MRLRKRRPIVLGGRHYTVRKPVNPNCADVRIVRGRKICRSIRLTVRPNRACRGLRIVRYDRIEDWRSVGLFILLNRRVS
jgi:hypothetical protein